MHAIQRTQPPHGAPARPIHPPPTASGQHYRKVEYTRRRPAAPEGRFEQETLKSLADTLRQGQKDRGHGYGGSANRHSVGLT